MDTRTKILTVEQAVGLRLSAPAVVTGHFDVLQAEHARALRAVRDRTRAAALVVVPLPGKRCLLDQRTRAELVAALRVVDYVVTADHATLDKLLYGLRPCELVRLDAADDQRTRSLIEYVRRRQAR